MVSPNYTMVMEALNQLAKMSPVAAGGSEDEITVTYTNGRKWTQKYVSEWTVVNSKGGGFNLQYTYFENLKEDDFSYTKNNDTTVEFETRLGDVAKVEAKGRNNHGTAYTKTFEFQPVKP